MRKLLLGRLLRLQKLFSDYEHGVKEFRSGGRRMTFVCFHCIAFFHCIADRKIHVK